MKRDQTEVESVEVLVEDQGFHKGSSEVKRTRLNALIHEYELFRMFPNETISELKNKVLRCLDRNWLPKVTAIMESEDLDSMALATLFASSKNTRWSKDS
ncbi:hypothetical protein Lal_00036783 [Lupinus albus]|nr:hypothetical protein Lal_00036783 [Lupinus albus]